MPRMQNNSNRGESCVQACRSTQTSFRFVVIMLYVLKRVVITTQLDVPNLGRDLPLRAGLRHLGRVAGEQELSRGAGRSLVLVRNRLRYSGVLHPQKSKLLKAEASAREQRAHAENLFPTVGCSCLSISCARHSSSIKRPFSSPPNPPCFFILPSLPRSPPPPHLAFIA